MKDLSGSFGSTREKRALYFLQKRLIVNYHWRGILRYLLSVIPLRTFLERLLFTDGRYIVIYRAIQNSKLTSLVV